MGAHIAAVGGIPDQSYDPVNLDRETLLAPGGRDFPVLTRTPGQGCRGHRPGQGGFGLPGRPGGVRRHRPACRPGDPMLDGMENRIARLAFAIPAVKGVAFGAGFAVADRRGSQNNDPSTSTRPARCAPAPTTPGDSGGITNGMPPGLPGGGEAHPLHRPAPGERVPCPGGEYHLSDPRPPRPLHRPRAVPCLRRSGHCRIRRMARTAEKEQREMNLEELRAKNRRH